MFAVDEENEHNQPSVNLCNAVEENTFYHIIIFDSTNVSRAKDSIVAHEFEHVVLQEKKFPVTFDTRRDYNFISRQLINLMEDPLIYPKLKSYFNVEEDLIMNVEGLKAQIRRDGLFLHGIYRATNSFCCARAHLMQRAFYEEDDHLGFYGFINDIIPEVIPEIDYIINIFEKNNYNTPEKQTRILEELTQHYHLLDYVRIKTIP
ncbi:MAG: hypothetical protein IMZ58_07120 [Thermoplasmata archaeon]|nr:hypothetical protein [Thermoplasmata archaeon]